MKNIERPRRICISSLLKFRIGGKIQSQQKFDEIIDLCKEDNVMSIKYIEKAFNGTGIFTSVEKISDNWNPDADYGNEYVRVHFRIDTPTFDGYDGFFKSN